MIILSNNSNLGECRDLCQGYSSGDENIKNKADEEKFIVSDDEDDIISKIEEVKERKNLEEKVNKDKKKNNYNLKNKKVK